MVNIQKCFNSQKVWLRGGIFGVIICVVLFLFNLFVYFPIIENVYGGVVPGWALIPPTVTGHTFPILSHFIIPYGWLCKFSEPICTHWSAKDSAGPNCVPWTDSEGGAGCCMEQTMTPTTACANLSEIAGFWGITILLLVAYFMLGAIIGRVIEKRKKK